MSKDIKEAKRVKAGISECLGIGRIMETQLRILSEGQTAIRSVIQSMGQMLVESILLIERESIAGPDYAPSSKEITKGGSQRGSVFLGDEKIQVRCPRVQSKTEGEISLKGYEAMKRR